MTLNAPKPTRLLATLGLSSALLFTSGLAVSGPHHDHSASPAFSTPAAQRAQAETATQDLINEHRLWVQSRGNGKKLGLAKLIEKAQARQALLTNLAETNPAEILRIAIPADVAQDLPTEVQELIEQHIDLNGELEVSYEDDFVNPQNSRLVHQLKTNNGNRVKLHISGDAGPLNTGNQINAKGVVFTNTQGEENLVVDAEDEGILMLAVGGDETGGSNGGTPVSPYNTVGQQDTLVLLVNFQDNSGQQPWSTSQVNSAVFGDVSNYFNENSYGKTSLVGATKGWYTLPLSSSSCNNKDIATAAKQAASNAGVNVSAYDRFLYIFPYTTACSWSGTALVGGAEAWINGTIDMDVIAHEMGHNFGLHHSHSLACNGTTLGDNCQNLEYGDGVDVMGWASSSHFAPFPKEYLGWLNQSNTPSIQHVTGAGTYQIEAYASQTNGTKALKIQKGFDQWGHPEYYYIEYRQPIGFDATMTSTNPSNVMNGVVIRTGTPEESSNTSFLLDMTPETYDLYTRDPALTFGRSFTDADAGVTITAVSGDQNSAVVTVSMGTQSCVRSNPSINFTPAQGPWVNAGTAVTYNVTVTNNDGAACSSNSYNLSANTLSGWDASFSTASLSLAPGQSSSSVLTVSSANSAADGFYDINVSAVSGNYSNSGNVTYVVDNPAANTPPVAQNDSAATSTGSSVVISVLNNDSDADGDSLNITSVSGVNGNAVINSNGTITFTPAAGFAGTEVFNYSLSDGNGGSDNASVSVSVSAVNNNAAPVAVNDSVTMSSKTTQTISVLSNDYDPENDSLSVVAVSQGNKGSVSINSNGTIRYVPAKSFKSSDSFTYTISDGQKTSTATVYLSLSGDSGGSNGKGNGKKH